MELTYHIGHCSPEIVRFGVGKLMNVKVVAQTRLEILCTKDTLQHAGDRRTLQRIISELNIARNKVLIKIVDDKNKLNCLRLS